MAVGDGSEGWWRRGCLQVVLTNPTTLVVLVSFCVVSVMKRKVRECWSMTLGRRRGYELYTSGRTSVYWLFSEGGHLPGQLIRFTRLRGLGWWWYVFAWGVLEFIAASIGEKSFSLKVREFLQLIAYCL